MEAIQRTRRPRSLAELLTAQRDQIAAALPQHIDAERMTRVCMTALRTTPKLAECSAESFLGSVMAASQLGLEPNTPLGHCYLIPRFSRKAGGTECTLMLGYQGMMELARRSGKVRRLLAYVVREGDEFDWRLGISPDIRHRPSGDSTAPITHAYAVARLEHGDDVFVVLTRDEIEKRRARGASGAGKRTPWDSDYQAMALKSALRALWTLLPKSAEMAQAVAVDEEGARLGEPLRALAATVQTPRKRLLSKLNGEVAGTEASDAEDEGSTTESGCAADPADASAEDSWK